MIVSCPICDRDIIRHKGYMDGYLMDTETICPMGHYRALYNNGDYRLVIGDQEWHWSSLSEHGIPTEDDVKNAKILARAAWQNRNQDIQREIAALRVRAKREHDALVAIVEAADAYQQPIYSDLLRAIERGREALRGE